MAKDTETNGTEFDADFTAPNETPKQSTPRPPVQSAPVQAEQPAAAPQEIELTDEEVEAYLKQRIVDAHDALEAARAKQKEGQKEEVAALAAYNEAQADYKREFPPLTAAENIKEYLASEQEKRRQRIEGSGSSFAGGARVDQAFSRGNSRGWRRPIRGVIGRDGNLVKNADGTIAVPRPMQVRPNPVVPSMRPTGGPVQRG